MPRLHPAPWIVLFAACLAGCRLTPADYVSIDRHVAACDMLNSDETVTAAEREAARVAFLRLLGPVEVRAGTAPPPQGELEHARALYPKKQVDAVPIQFVPHRPYGARVTFTVRIDAASPTRTFIAPATEAELYHLADLRAPSEGDRVDDPFGALVGATIDAGVGLLTLGVVHPGAYAAARTAPNTYRKATPEEAAGVDRVVQWVRPGTGEGEAETRLLLFVEGNLAETWRPPTSHKLVDFVSPRLSTSRDDLLVTVTQPLSQCEVTHYSTFDLPAGDTLSARVTRALQGVQIGAMQP